ncbi:MAG: acyl--CoA ligase [Alphaproteobacteria bacterium]
MTDFTAHDGTATPGNGTTPAANADALSLPEAIAHWAVLQPDALAIITTTGRLTYRELSARVVSLAGSLSANGVEAGDSVVVTPSGRMDMLAAVAAAMSIGAVPVPMSGVDHEVVAVARDCEAALVVADAGRCGRLADVIRDDSTRPDGWSGEDGVMVRPDEAPGMLIYTSGTTAGWRRGVMVSRAALTASVRALSDLFDMGPATREMVLAPLHHSFGLTRCRAVLHAGGTLVVQEGAFAPASACMAMETFGCTVLSAQPSVLATLVQQYGPILASRGRSLRRIVTGTMPLASAHRERLLDLMPHVQVTMVYGLSEATHFSILNMRAEPGRLESVGRPIAGNDVLIAGRDGTPVPGGWVGHILIRTPVLASGYWRRESAWQERLRDGWFDTGDIGRLDRDGYLYVIGRDDDLINVGGEKIAPAEIEDQLAPLLKGAACAVCGVLDPDGIQGWIPVLFVEGHSAPSAREVADHLRDRVAEFKIPAVVRAIPLLPRTSSGKVIRRSLAMLAG